MAQARDFDLVVIGAGMAGFAAISKAAVLGARAAIIEEAELGGT
jgi:pyruvate/2-oxoglutarate dehydrogenase complex dihydrolipoamide dehydrogenase (E3) component